MKFWIRKAILVLGLAILTYISVGLTIGLSVAYLGHKLDLLRSQNRLDKDRFKSMPY